MKKLLLCVGDEQPLWQELRLATTQPGSTWAAQFACTGAEATALASQTRSRQLSPMSN
jgi:hypothetical protein